MLFDVTATIAPSSLALVCLASSGILSLLLVSPVVQSLKLRVWSIGALFSLPLTLAGKWDTFLVPSAPGGVKALRGRMGGIQFARPLVPGRFLRRLNRFAALVEVGGRREQVHVRTSGRLRELLVPGRPVLLEPADAGNRSTRFTLALVRLSHGFVSADAHLANALVAEALQRHAIPGFRGYRILRREPAMGRNRADFLLARGKAQCILEVKSVTLVKGGVALFPDAPTLRGRTHLAHLVALRLRGVRAGILFVIQRGDAKCFAPNWNADPQFGEALHRASRSHVRVGALVCRVNPRVVRVDKPVPVRIGRRGSRRVRCERG